MGLPGSGARVERQRGRLFLGDHGFQYVVVFLAVFLVVWATVRSGGRRVTDVGEDARLVVDGEAISWKGIVVPEPVRMEAVKALREVVGKRVRIEDGFIWHEDRNLAGFLVARGLARVDTALQGPARAELEALENSARAAGRGVWEKPPP
ncbi:MAG: thermonuclease family protein [Planctomycetes bacterium]|nr:thermonuclease family protein [Planctomycetota bacterium]